MKRNGFTLIELSIVIVMIGIIAGAIIAGYQELLHSVEPVEQGKRIEGLKVALEDYQRTHGVLPCPAVGSLTPGDANYGVASADCVTTCPAGLTCTTEAAFGVVPFKTLEIPQFIAQDESDRYIGYAVDRKFTNSKCGTAGRIRINDMSGNAITTGATFALVSYGANEAGSFSINGGSAKACNMTVSDAENCNNDNIFKLQHYVDTAGASYYDDIVTYGTNIFRTACPDNMYGCTLWLDTSDYCAVGIDTSISATAVTSVQDKSVNYVVASQATGGSMPAYQAAAGAWINGNKNILFSNDLLSITSSTIVPTTNFSISVVFNSTSASGTLFGVTNGSAISAGGDRFLGLNSGKAVFYMSGLGTITSGASYNDGKTHIMTVVVNTSTGTTLYVDGSSVGTSAVGTSTFAGQTNVNIGGNTSANAWDYFNGSILDIAVYNSALTSNQRAGLETWFAKKWAVTY